MEIYRTKTLKLSGTDLSEVKKKIFPIFLKIKNKSKRKPYIRSCFFKKEKIFLDLFWPHLHEKNPWDRLRRMKLFPCSIELIKYSKQKPISIINPNKKSEILHRFGGITPYNEKFIVQIKENKISNKKWLISVFPL